MSAAAREVTWAGGKHVFDLNSRRVAWMLNDGFPGQYGTSVFAAFKRFEERVHSPLDIANVFRVGLLGGGMSEKDTDALIADHVRGQPYHANAVIAHGLIVAIFEDAPNANASA